MAENEYHIIHLQFEDAKRPEFKESPGNDYIKFGEDDAYPEYLAELSRKSPKHGAIIKGKVRYIFGNGFEHNPAINANGESLNKVFKKCVKDDEKFGGFALQIIWNRLGRIATISHLPFKSVRVAIRDGVQCGYQVKKNWTTMSYGDSRLANNKEEPRYYPEFDVNKPVGSHILYVSQTDDSDYYPMPEYIQCLNYIESDITVSQHILGMGKAGFTGNKLINLNNGEPAKEEKARTEEALKKKFSGGDGQRVVLSFNKSKETATEVLDLGNHQLTKEDFTNVNNLIQQEIFSGHGVTNPMLFGIKTEGQLGGRLELREAFEIFKNTYANERQKEHEELWTGLMKLSGMEIEMKIVPIEPIGVEFSEDTLLKLGLPKAYFYDKLGIDINDYPPDNPGATVAPVAAEVNQNVSNLSGRQMQQLNRVVKQFQSGKITKEQAALLLKNGFGFTDEQVNAWLGVDDDPNTADQQFADVTDDLLYAQFAQFGEQKQLFTLVKQSEFTRDTFKDVSALTQLEVDVLDMVQNDKLVTADTVATALKKPVETIAKTIAGLKDGGHLVADGSGMKVNKIPPGKKEPKGIVLRYSYEGPYDSRNRPFCRKLLDLDRYYSRAEIETISERMGYSVFDRRGGWWTMPDGTRSPSCRHSWKVNILIENK